MIWRRVLLLPAVALLLVSAGLGEKPQPPLVVVLIGPPASGKSTQADYLKRKYKIPIISVEELVANAPGGGPGVRNSWRGDPVLNDLLRKRIETINRDRGFALDGYPSTRAQAAYLDKLTRELHLPSPIIIQIHIPDHVVYERAAHRGGPDDKPENISRRLAEYHREMDMIRDYYPKANIWTIDGTRPPRGVSATIRLLIEDRE